MESAASRAKSVRFGLFELDNKARELRKQGIRIKLQDQPLEILGILLRHPGELVTRDHLRAAIWPADTFVDFDKGLYSAVNRLRDALQDSAENPRFIETVPKRGYRFIAPVMVIEQDEIATPSPEVEASVKGEVFETMAEPRPPRFGWKIRVAGVFFLLLALSTVVKWPEIWNLITGRDTLHVRSLAVLPLENLSGDPAQDPFAEEMTEELIAQFSKSPDLLVISRTSVMQYKGSKKPLPQIAAELNVDAAVEGTVERVGDRIRISAQLLDARLDHQLWADTYDRDFKDILSLQSEVARDVAARCEIKLPARPKWNILPTLRTTRTARRLEPMESDSYEAYLMGRYYWNKRTGSSMKAAAEYFQQAIQKNPRNALPYTGLADFYAFLSLIGGPEIAPPKDVMPKAKAAAQQAEQLDGALAEAHASMGHILHNYDWDWAGAEREFKQAIQLNPSYATAHHWYSHYLMQMGRTQESLAEALRAHELDPLSPFINNGLARQYFLSRQYDKAIGQAQKALEIDSGYVPAVILIGMAYEQKSMYPEAIAEYDHAQALAGSYAVNKDKSSDKEKSVLATALPVVVAMQGHALALSGHRAEAKAKLQELLNISRVRYVAPSYVAVIYIGLGNKDEAFKWLEKDLQNRSEHLLYLTTEPMVDQLRNDPRFRTLVARVGLPM